MLKLTHISKTFNPGTVNAKKAIEDLSFHAAKGDFITVIGANGAGKSTLFNAISGSFFTDSGKIELDGKDITFMPEYKRARSIGRLFQDPMRGSAPGMTIEENLALAAGHGGWLSSISRKDRQAFRERLSLLGMGLEDRMTQPVGLLSGGQRQRIAIARAMALNPDVIVCDEAVSALDVLVQDQVLRLLNDLQAEKGLSYLFITHDLAVVRQIADEVVVMQHGKLVEHATTDEVFDHPQKQYTRDLLDAIPGGKLQLGLD